LVQDRISVMLTVQSRDGDTAGSWPRQALTAPIDLVDLLADVAHADQDPSRVHEYLAKEIRDRIGGDLAVTLNLDHGAQNRQMVTPVLRWAADLLRVDIGNGLRDDTVDDEGNDTSTLFTRDDLGPLDDVIADPTQLDTRDAYAFLVDAINAATQMHGYRHGQGPPLEPPSPFGLIVTAPGPLAQRIAFELGAPVRINEINPDGTTVEWTATPSGKLTRTPPAPDPDPTPPTGPTHAPNQATQPDTTHDADPDDVHTTAPTVPTPYDVDEPTIEAEPEPGPSTSRLDPPPAPNLPASTLAEALTRRAEDSPQAWRLLDLAKDPALARTDSAELAGAFEALELLRVTTELDRPAADQTLLELIKLVATDQVIAGDILTAIGLLKLYGLLETTSERNAWIADHLLAELRETINRLDKADPNHTAAEQYVHDLANNAS
jgi:hypothetical protein